MELAADAFRACGSTRSRRLQLDGLAERMLPEDTGWWHLDDLWRHALDAVVVFVRAAAERQDVPVETVCRSLTDS